MGLGAISVALLVVTMYVLWRLTFGGGGGGGEPKEAFSPYQPEPESLGQVSSKFYPAQLTTSIVLTHTDEEGKPTAESAAMPADAAVIDGRVFVLDTDNGRILELGPQGEVARVLDQGADEKLKIKGAMAMTEHQGKLYIANSNEGTVLRVDPSGRVEDVITPKADAGEHPLRPIGLAVAADGQIVMSDPDNHRVLRFSPGGDLLASLGSGKRDSGDYGFNTPGAVALDGEGNLYVLDMLNSAVKKYSPDGQFLLSIGGAGDTEGSFSRPKGLTVDSAGNIFVSDALMVAVQVFAPTGEYAGFIGRQEPENKESDSLFQWPSGLKAVDGTLYVVDRFAGLFEFQLPPAT
jgi:sugar lactone lactonase YvrE